MSPFQVRWADVYYYHNPGTLITLRDEQVGSRGCFICAYGLLFQTLVEDKEKQPKTSNIRLPLLAAMSFFALTLLATLGIFTPIKATLTNSTDCAALHFMLARGTTESYPGTPYSLAEIVAGNTSLSSNYENIIYPAVAETSSDSYFVGRAAVGEQITRYVQPCPDSKIILLSYSQGAMIVGDALAGGGGNATLGNATEPVISRSVGQNTKSNANTSNLLLCPVL